MHEFNAMPEGSEEQAVEEAKNIINDARQEHILTPPERKYATDKETKYQYRKRSLQNSIEIAKSNGLEELEAINIYATIKELDYHTDKLLALIYPPDPIYPPTDKDRYHQLYAVNLFGKKGFENYINKVARIYRFDVSQLEQVEELSQEDMEQYLEEYKNILLEVTGDMEIDGTLTDKGIAETNTGVFSFLLALKKKLRQVPYLFPLTMKSMGLDLESQDVRF